MIWVDITAHFCRRSESRLTTVLESGWYILGAEVSAFEESFAAYCGVAHCVGVGNGTDALELALRALRMEAGTRWLPSPMQAGTARRRFAAPARDPLYVDVDPDRCRWIRPPSTAESPRGPARSS